MASSSITGDFGKLSAWQKLLDEVPAVLEQISDSGAEEVLGLISDEFRSETDPYGKRWKPKQRADGRKTLSGKTSRLKKWQKKRASKDGFVVAPTVDYAAPHQSPKDGKRPQRLMVPTTSRGLPIAWSKALEETAVEALSVHLTTEEGGGSGKLGTIVAYKIIGLKRRFNVKALVKKLSNAASE